VLARLTALTTMVWWPSNLQ